MLKILVIEDDEDILDVLRIIIENAGYVVITALGGKQGLELAKRERPDLIITDVLMPGLSGYDVYKRLKKEKITAIIPVLILSARGAMKETFKMVGADDFLAKPFEDHVLLSKIAGLLSRPNVLSPPPLPRNLQKRKILIAGIHQELVTSLAQQLQAKGQLVRTTTSGKDLMPRLVSFTPNLLLMNVQLSGAVNAVDMVVQIRNLPQFKKLPILLYSHVQISELGSQGLHEHAQIIDKLKTAGLKAGATAYIGEFHHFSFVSKIERFLV